MAIYAVDAGGTRTKLALVEQGTILARATLDARSDHGLGDQLPRIVAALKEMAPQGKNVSGIGIAFPSIVDSKAGRVVGHVGKYVDAQDLDLSEWARAEFGLRLAIENDARMACIGEWQYGAGRGYSSMVTMTLGTGIGTGVVMNGKPLTGEHGQAGILGGHFVMRPNGRQCACGSRGCFETEASTAWLRRLAREESDFEASLLSGCEPLDYEAVYSAANAGDPCAIRMRERAWEIWGALAVTLIHAYDPSVLIVGGGIMASGETTLAPIRSIVERDAWTPLGKPPVVAAELGNDAALLACEWLLSHKDFETHEIAPI